MPDSPEPPPVDDFNDPSPSRSRRAWRFVKQHPGATLLATASLVAVVSVEWAVAAVAGGGALWALLRRRRTRSTTDER